MSGSFRGRKEPNESDYDYKSVPLMTLRVENSLEDPRPPTTPRQPTENTAVRVESKSSLRTPLLRNSSLAAFLPSEEKTAVLVERVSGPPLDLVRTRIENIFDGSTVGLRRRRGQQQRGVDAANTDAIALDEFIEKVLKPEPRERANNEIALSLLRKQYIEARSVASQGRALAIALVIGFMRDFIWAYVTEKKGNHFGNKLDAFWGETLTQMVWALPAIIGGGSACLKVTCSPIGNGKSFFFQRNTRTLGKKVAVIGLSSWSAIPVWNGAQWLGVLTGKKLQLNTRDANYFAGLFTGVAETLWQNALVIPRLLGESADSLEVFLNTLGGAVWQWVYFACTENLENEKDVELKTSASVAFSVAASTLLMTLLAWMLSKNSSTPRENVVNNRELPHLEDNRNRLFTRRDHAYDDLDLTATRTQNLRHNRQALDDISVYRQPRASSR